MRLLFVADGRSPIAINWMRHFVERGDEVHLVSTFACQPELALASLHILPVAFSGMKKSTAEPAALGALGSSRLVGLRTAVRDWLGPLSLPRAGRILRRIIAEIQPELIHALRIPYEGMLAAEAYSGIPLVVSVWGNDFTLHGPSGPLMRHYTAWAMKVADALHADCQRDVRLARAWGFDSGKPSLVIPGNGGIRLDIFGPPMEPVHQPAVLNPRGFRAYIRNDSFFRAIPLVLQRYPQARFVCASMAGQPQALEWINELGIAAAVELLPPLPHARMAEVFRSAQVAVSPGTHDGTPNTLLEAMACGCFPVASDLESIREWITPGRNGLLVDPADPASIAEGIMGALENESLRLSAAGFNQQMLASRAEYGACMQQAEHFYTGILQRSG